jgi:hypothetical protein
MITWDWTVFFLGAAGAFAPELIRLWGIKTEPSKFVWSNFYLVVSLLFCGFGGLMAVCLQPDSAWKAIYAGVTMPVVISSALRAGGTRGRPSGGGGLKSATAPAGAARPAGLRAFVEAL